MKQIKLKSLSIAMENTETITVLAENIVSFRFYKIHEGYIKPHNWGNNSSEILKTKTAENVKFIISPNGNTSYESYNMTSQYSVFERLTKFNDICSLILEFDDNTTEEINVCWPEDYDIDEVNPYQTFKFLTDGSLEITINPSV